MVQKKYQNVFKYSRPIFSANIFNHGQNHGQNQVVFGRLAGDCWVGWPPKDELVSSNDLLISRNTQREFLSMRKFIVMTIIIYYYAYYHFIIITSCILTKTLLSSSLLLLLLYSRIFVIIYIYAFIIHYFSFVEWYVGTCLKLGCAGGWFMCPDQTYRQRKQQQESRPWC